MSRVKKWGDVTKEKDGTFKILVASDETTETWTFRLVNNIAVLIQGRNGALCGTLFLEARSLAEGLLFEAARNDRRITLANQEKNNVVQISSHKKRRTWHDEYGIAGTD